MSRVLLRSVAATAAAALVSIATAGATPVRTRAGLVEGTASADGAVRIFRGIPFAAPPVGDLRWRPPQPHAPWEGVRKATDFASYCAQGRIYDDMVFHGQPSEDCLYLNVWTPARSAGEKLPVMVWIHGGGFNAGAADEPRHEGTPLARKGVVVVTINYRLGVFGFLAHPELTAESGRHASGNYGLMDQLAALRWVHDDIAAFGGDPAKSGAYLDVLPPLSLADSEKKGVAFGETVGAPSLAALRAQSAETLLAAALKVDPWFEPTVDGYVLPNDPAAVYAAGEQLKVPLLAGWNADEIRAGVVLGDPRPTAAGFAEQVRARFGPAADAMLKVYPAATDAEATESAAALAGDTFLVYATWKWIVEHARTSGAPVYRYRFDRKIPVAPGTLVNGVEATADDVGARHAGEIEYVFGTLDSVPRVTWTDADRKLSDLMSAYWSNFARTGDPNGPGLSAWPRFTAQRNGPQIMHLDVNSEARPDVLRTRYETLDRVLSAARAR
jgi:para-nitrobenzyl esterase